VRKRVGVSGEKAVKNGFFQLKIFTPFKER
jgi:hypothetical protein